MQDNFPIGSDISPARNYETITPSDDDELPRRYKSLFIGIAGDITLVGDNGDEVLHTVPAGFVMVVSPVKVMATGTDADQIVGWW